MHQNSNDGISPSDSQTFTTSCSNEVESDLAMIDYRIRPKSIDDDNVSVTKVPRLKKMNSATRSLYREFDEAEDLSSQRLNSSGTVRVTRIKSSVKEKSMTIDDQSMPRQEENSITETPNVIRVTRVPSTPATTEDICRPSIVENTIRLDENNDANLLNSLSNNDRNRVRVKRVRSSHRTSAIETRPSQIDTIELPPLSAESSCKKSPSVRIKRVPTAKKKLKSAKVIIPFESILEIESDKTDDRQKTRPDFGVTVERIPREKSSKSTK